VKILITEIQLKTLLSELNEDPKKGEEKEDPKKGEEKEDPKKGEEKEKEIGLSSDYIDDIELEQIDIVYNPETKETSGKVVDWEYGGSKTKRKRKKSYWIAKDINISGLRNKINKFAKSYIDHMSNNINSYVGPVITSGYRGPKRQIDAVWNQWEDDKNYLKSSKEGGVGYSRVFGIPIEKIFVDYEDKPKKAKKLAIDFLKEKETEGKYMSNHQDNKAIDISLFKDSSKNDEILKFLEKSKKNGDIADFIDERKKSSPHFHIKLF
jgi:hypothetical protein